MSLLDMAAKSGVAKGWEVRQDGICRSSDRDYPGDDWTPIDAMQISLIAEQHGWDPDGWFASKWETLVHTPMRPIFDKTWIEWRNPSGSYNAALCWWDESSESVWCQFATSAPCVSWIGSALIKPTDFGPHVCLIPYLGCEEVVRTAWRDDDFRRFTEADNPVNWLPGDGLVDDRSKPERLAAAALFWWGFLPVTLLALKLPHVKNIQISEKPRSLARRHKRRSGKKFTWRQLLIAPQAAAERGGRGLSRDLLAAHLVRGHFKTFTSDAPLFGKHVGTYWIHPHSRGNAKNGFVTKDYEIGAQE